MGIVMFVFRTNGKDPRRSPGNEKVPGTKIRMKRKERLRMHGKMQTSKQFTWPHTRANQESIRAPVSEKDPGD